MYLTHQLRPGGQKNGPAIFREQGKYQFDSDQRPSGVCGWEGHGALDPRRDLDACRHWKRRAILCGSEIRRQIGYTGWLRNGQGTGRKREFRRVAGEQGQMKQDDQQDCSQLSLPTPMAARSPGMETAPKVATPAWPSFDRMKRRNSLTAGSSALPGALLT